jgi:hypothetical protein
LKSSKGRQQRQKSLEGRRDIFAHRPWWYDEQLLVDADSSKNKTVLIKVLAWMALPDFLIVYGNQKIDKLKKPK